MSFVVEMKSRFLIWPLTMMFTVGVVTGTTGGTVVDVLLKTVLKMLSRWIEGWTASGVDGSPITTLIAASLVAVPEILFLDEPTTGLDPRSRLQMWEVIEGLVADGTTVLLTTQYLEEADQLAHEIVVIDHGKVIAQGTSDQLKSQVGGDRLEVVVRDAAQGPAAAAALAPLAGEAPTADQHTVTAPVSGGSVAIVDAVRRLDEAGVAIADIALRRPTLDDVFLALTGHAAADDQPATGETR